MPQEPYKPMRISGNITLDGKLTEPNWKLAKVEDDFMQYDPSTGAEPSEKIEIRMLYNDEHRFIGFSAFDDHLRTIVKYSLQRDFELAIADGFVVAIDMYRNRSTGFALMNNT